MEQYRLQNEHLSVAVSAMGAELQGLYSHKTGLEYLWQPGGETWPHHSLLLFPNPGRIAHDRTIIGGKVYPAMMHGFACTLPFAVTDHSDTQLVMELAASDYTRKFYPYEFRLVVEFSLEGDTLVQTFRVVNEDTQPVYYCLGAHPGFYCPIGLNEPAEDYSLVFDRAQSLNLLTLQENTRLLTGEKTPYRHGQAQISLHDGFFDNGPMLFDGMDAATVTLRSEKSGRFVEFGIEGFPNLCLWGVPTKMSLIAIEPWIGLSDHKDTDHVWETKPGIQRIEVGSQNTHRLTFRVG